MGQRLILDTGVLIAVERGRLRLDSVLAPEDDVVIAAISIAEYATGVLLATTENTRATLCRSKCHCCWPIGMSVLVDETARPGEGV